MDPKERGEACAEIMVVPFFGHGHLFPSTELCARLASPNLSTTLVIPSNLSSSVPSSLRRNPFVSIAEIASSPSPPPPPPMMMIVPGGGCDPLQHHDAMARGLEALLQESRAPPACAVVDIMMSWSKQVFAKFGVPAASFFTSGACSMAMEYAVSKARPHLHDLKPGEIQSLPGLPEDMALTYSELKQQQQPPPPPPPRHDPFGPGSPRPPPPMHHRHPKFGDRPMWFADLEGSIGLLVNTCTALERPFIEYIADHIRKPVWAVGPLLPEQYWTSSSESLSGHRAAARKSNYTEDEVIQWLDSKPRGSVLYVSFGTEVSPAPEELNELADALESSSRPFVWAIHAGSGRPGPTGTHLSGPEDKDPEEGCSYYPHGLDKRVGNRGLIIRGWAPQLLILSHPSMAAFLSHCGWNSTLEAIGRGVPLLAWPVRGDQFFNAKLVVSHLKVGHLVPRDGGSSDIRHAVEELMTDEEVKRRAATTRAMFEEHGFLATSRASLDAFKDIIIKLKTSSS